MTDHATIHHADADGWLWHSGIVPSERFAYAHARAMGDQLVKVVDLTNLDLIMVVPLGPDRLPLKNQPHDERLTYDSLAEAVAALDLEVG